MNDCTTAHCRTRTKKVAKATVQVPKDHTKSRRGGSQKKPQQSPGQRTRQNCATHPHKATDPILKIFYLDAGGTKRIRKNKGTSAQNPVQHIILNPSKRPKYVAKKQNRARAETNKVADRSTRLHHNHANRLDKRGGEM